MTETQIPCIACGMPMRRAEDHAQADPAKDFCNLCARPDGSMCSYEEACIGVTKFLVRTQGLDETAAKAIAEQTLAGLPAWADRTVGNA